MLLLARNLLANNIIETFTIGDFITCYYRYCRDIVAASHIKPLEKDDRLENINFVQRWNSQATHEKIEGVSENAQLTQVDII